MDYLNVSGRASREALFMVAPLLSAQEKDGAFWYFLKSSPADLKVGEEFAFTFDITPSGIIVPLAETGCLLQNLHQDKGKYYGIKFYRENPQFKQLWGWRPLGLLKFQTPFPRDLEMNYEENTRGVDRWQIAQPFYLGSQVAFENLSNREPPLGVEGVQEYLRALENWKVGHNYVATFIFHKMASLQDSFDLRLKFRLVETQVANWQDSVRTCAIRDHKFSRAQVNKLLVLIHKTCIGPISRTWNAFFDPSSGGLNGVSYADFVIEAGGELFWLHFSWSD